MNTHDKYELPPLPDTADDNGRFGHGDMKRYARSAIEADRHRRGEPVGYINPAHIGQGHGSGIFWTKDQSFNKPVYEAPQPAEPSWGEPVGYIMPTALKQLKAGGNAIVGGVSQGCDVLIYTAPQPAEPSSIRALIASDPYALTFQSIGQYRTALLRAIDEMQPAEPVKVPSGDEIWQFTYDFNKGSFRDSDDVIDYARALLNKYGAK